jgi:predicted N-acetyltransferase YhbS
MTFRPYRQGDDDALARLLTQLGHPIDPATLAQRIVKQERNLILVAETDGKPVGFVSWQIEWVLTRERPVAHLTALVVDQRLRQLGIGSALVAQVEKAARKIGCEMLFVLSNRSRPMAHAFYSRNGFRHTHYTFNKVF